MHYNFSLDDGELIYTVKKLHKRGITISLHEIELLKLTYANRSLTSNQIHNFYSITSNKKSEAISNRIRRFIYMNVLRRKKRTTSNQYVYSLGELGARVVNVATNSNFANGKYEMRMPSLHEEGIASFFVNLYSRNTLFEKPYKFKVTRGVVHPFFIDEIDFSLLPDLVVEYDDKLICLEYDRKKEAAGIILNKSQRYIQAQKQLAKKGKKLIVIYAIGSEVDEPRSHKRIESLKQKHSSYADELKNTPIYFLDDEESVEFVFKIFENQYVHTKNERKSISMLQEAARMDLELTGKNEDLIGSILQANELAYNMRTTTYFNELLFTANHYKNYSGNDWTNLFIIGEYGSLETYLKVKELLLVLRRLTDFHPSDKFRYVTIHIIYPYASLKDLNKEVMAYNVEIPTYLYNFNDMKRIYERYETDVAIPMKPYIRSKVKSVYYCEVDN